MKLDHVPPILFSNSTVLLNYFPGNIILISFQVVL